MQITIPTIEEQQRQIVADGIKKAIKQLQANIDAPVFAPQTERDEAQYSNAHLLDKARYEPPHPDIVGAYFRHFQSLMADYDSDKKLAALLGVSSDRRVREFKQGKAAVPYEIWDRFFGHDGPQTTNHHSSDGVFRIEKENTMNPKTRILTMATLCVLSLLGGWVGRQFYAETGLVIGSLGTFTLLALALIAAGKVKLSR